MMLGDEVPFYADIKFWSLVISIFALLLSQAKFFLNLFRRAKIDAEVYAQMYVGHKFGNPSAQLHLILLNSGGRKVRIKGVRLAVRKSSGDSFFMPALTYLQKQGDVQPILFTPFSMQSGEEWAHIVNFCNPFSRQDEKLIREASAVLRANIDKKNSELRGDVNHPIVQADESLMMPFRSIFNKYFRWMAEEYEMAVEIETEPPSAFKTQSFRFVLFEGDIAEMIKSFERCSTGAGVCFQNDLPEGVIVSLGKIANSA